MNRLNLFLLILISSCIQACNGATSAQESLIASSVSQSSAVRFAGGPKSVKIITSNALLSGSFPSPTPAPALTPIPSPFPGSLQGAAYLPGNPATRFYDVDGVTSVAKPAWLLDFQLGTTSTTPNLACAAFGGNDNADASSFYRVSETDCGNTVGGSGSNLDPVFIRIILNRNATSLGLGENLLMQVEYQASGLHLNTDGISQNPEDNLDQLWKIFWNSSLAAGSVPNAFSMFVPPQYSACLESGSQTTGMPGNCTAGYRGAAITTKQIIIPLSAYPSMSVIQFSRLQGRINHSSSDQFTASPGDPVNYVKSFLSSDAECASNSPLCLGLVVRSVLLMRM